MEIQKTELQKAINSLKPGLAKKEIIEQSSYIIFDKDKLRTYNDEISITIPFKSDIKGAVIAEDLIKYLNSIKINNLDITIDNGYIRFNSKKSKAGIVFVPEIKISFDEIQINKNWEFLPKDFISAVKSSLSSVSVDFTRQVLTYIHCTDRFAESSDRKRLTRFTYNEPSKKAFDFLLPGKAAVVVTKYNPNKFMICNSWIHFKNKDGLIFSCRTTGLTFPNTEPILKCEKKKGFKLQLDISDIIKEVSIFAKDDYGATTTIMVHVFKNTLKLRAENKKGFAEHFKTLKYKGDEIKFFINPDFFESLCSKGSNVYIDDLKVVIENENVISSIALMTKAVNN